MNHLLDQLSGGDRRSVGAVAQVIAAVRGQADFDLLFAGLSSGDRLIAMRAADAVEKITVRRPEYLEGHRTELLALLFRAEHKELKWHLAQLAGRIVWDTAEIEGIWDRLTAWAGDPAESRIVRVNALQSLAGLQEHIPHKAAELRALLSRIALENIPSLNARLRRLRQDEK